MKFLLSRNDAIKHLKEEKKREADKLYERWREMVSACSTARSVLRSSWRGRYALRCLAQASNQAFDAFSELRDEYDAKVKAIEALPEIAQVEVESR